ncbi:MAG: aldehyde dehydrogenase family protein [Actinobacteria bacterium]|nr:aldehyde dehydrogenase family protein [Actinomycetota bacterium]
MSATHTEHGTIEIPEAPHQIPATSKEDIDKAIAAVAAQKDAWAVLDIPTRVRILDQLVEDTLPHVEEWVERDNAVKRIPEGSPSTGEGWTNGPWILLRGLRLLKESLEQIERTGRPALPSTPTTRPDGQVVVEVFPRDFLESAIFPGFSAEVWLQPHVSLADLEEEHAAAYRGDPAQRGGDVSLVLGAGNVSAIPAMDAISKLFLEHQVVVLKMNPVNEHVGPVFEKALRALIDRDFLRIVYGGADEGMYLTDHDGIDVLHMTGSDKTFEAIVFGPGEEGQRRKENREEPRLDKPITAELGNVTPVIVVPGPWSDKDLDFHGENIVTGLINNVGFNCIANRVVITHRNWARRRDLMDAVRKYLALAPDRYAYYPGAEDRWERFVEEHPEAERFGAHAEGCLPRTLIPAIDPDHEDDIAFNTEAFAPIMAETALDAPRSVPAFIERAVRFCNERLWGTLAATIIVHPRSMKDPQIAEAVERAVADLRYGTIGVNHWPGLAYSMGTTTWGAFPGHDIYDIQSGIGHVHNFLMLPDPEKSVLRGPFRTPTKLPWFVTHGRSHEVVQKLTRFDADPSIGKLPSIAWSAMRP